MQLKSIVREPKKPCCSFAFLKAYKELFSNPAITWILVASGIRVLPTVITQAYTPQYFKVYPEQNELFSLLYGLSTFVCGVLTNLMSAIALDFYSSNPMIKT